MVTQFNRKLAASTVVALALALIVAMTLQPAFATVSLPFSCIFCGALGGVDFVLNTVLFAPLGLGLYLLFQSWKRALLTGVAVTLMVEGLQWRAIAGRDTSLGDLLANSLGTAIGIGLALVGLSCLSATGLLSRRLAGTFAVLCAAVVMFSSLLLQPMPARSPLAVQWMPTRLNTVDFTGRLHAAALNGVSVQATELLSPTRLMNPEDRVISVRAAIGGDVKPTQRQAIILRIAGHVEEGFFLGQWRESIIVRTHVTAERFKFRPLLIAADQVFSARHDSVVRAGTDVAIDVVSTPRAITVSLDRPDVPDLSVRRTAGLGWTLLLPWELAVTPRWWLANATWLGALVLPVGFFSTRSARHTPLRIATYWPIILSILSLIAGPALFGLSALGVGEWAGVLTGFVAGATLERLIVTDLRPTLREDFSGGT